MFKSILAALAAMSLAVAAHAAVDANQASQAELEAVKGIGPALSTSIVGERKKGEFKDWSDFMGRVKGVGERSAAKFSDSGLTVQGKPYAGVASGAGRTSTTTGGRSGKKAETPGKAERAKQPRSTGAGASAAKR
jgi:competence protein ComEA